MNARVEQIRQREAELRAASKAVDDKCYAANKVFDSTVFVRGGACYLMVKRDSSELRDLEHEEMELYVQGASFPYGDGGSHPGGVNVNGYTRSNGIYVSPYARSAPSHGGRH